MSQRDGIKGETAKPVIRLSDWIAHHYRLITWFSLILALVGGYFSVRLYQNIRPNIEELLPKTARSVMDLETVSDRLETTSNLAILTFCPDPAASKRFIIDLAKSLEEADPDRNLVSRLDYRIDEEIRFFKKRRALFLDIPDLKRVKNYIQDRIYYEQEIRNPLNIFAEREIPEPRLGIRSLENKYSYGISSYSRFTDGFYANQDKTIRVLFIYLTGSGADIPRAKELKYLVDQVIARLNPARYSSDLQIRFTGDVQNLLEETASIETDLLRSALIVFFLVTLSLLIYYRDLATTTALILSLFVGTLVTFGVSYFVIGYLNSNSAFQGSIILGNGINFGLIYAARYLEERRKGNFHEQAIRTAAKTTLPATLTAALAAGGAYGSLMVTEFRGFRQFGIIGAIGMVLCWLSAYLILPAMLGVVKGRSWPAAHQRCAPKHRFGKISARIVQHIPGSLLLASILLLFFSIYTSTSFLKSGGELLESDTSKLRDKTSMTEGSGFLSTYLDEIFERYTSPIVLLPRTQEATHEITRRLKEEKNRQGPESLIAGVYSMKDFIPDQQREKIAILREIRELLPPRILIQVSPKDRKLIGEFLTPEAFRPFGPEDLPEGIRTRFREKDGTEGKLVLIEPVYAPAIISIADNQTRFIANLRRIADSVEPATPMVGQIPLTADMHQAVQRDGPKATAVAFALVIGLVTLLFRKPRDIFMVTLGLLLGAAWLFAIICRWGMKINFLNFIALPITIGIGVDYAVNIVQRHRIDGRGSIPGVLRFTGSAVALASLTTVIGYGSLLMAGNQGFVSFGRIAILGELTCTFAAIYSVPALLQLLDSRRRRKAEQKPQAPAERPPRPARAA